MFDVTKPVELEADVDVLPTVVAVLSVDNRPIFECQRSDEIRRQSVVADVSQAEGAKIPAPSRLSARHRHFQRCRASRKDTPC